jgi:hypothetical protein
MRHVHRLASRKPPRRRNHAICSSTVKQSRALTSMIASRMAFGVAIWAFPGPVGKAFGVDITRDPLASYLSRLMGARDVALAWELHVTEGDAQRKWLLACMVCDAADTLAAIAAGRNGLSKRTTALMLAASLGPMVRGAVALREH